MPMNVADVCLAGLVPFRRLCSFARTEGTENISVGTVTVSSTDVFSCKVDLAIDYLSGYIARFGVA